MIYIFTYKNNDGIIIIIFLLLFKAFTRNLCVFLFILSTNPLRRYKYVCCLCDQKKNEGGWTRLRNKVKKK